MRKKDIIKNYGKKHIHIKHYKIQKPNIKRKIYKSIGEGNRNLNPPDAVPYNVLSAKLVHNLCSFPIHRQTNTHTE